ncbi:MAG: carbohydrate binding domain-containing protein [Fibrobacterales bacterium]
MKQLGLKALCLVFLTAILAYSAPSHGEAFNLKQPDGSVVPVKVWGDEFYQRVETLDGYTLVRDSDGWIVYADVSEDGGEFLPTEERYIDQSNKMRAQRTTVRKNKQGKVIRKGLKLSKKSRRQKARRAREEQTLEFSASSLGTQNAGTQMAVSADGLSGNVLGLTILVDFSDQEGSISPSEVSNFLQQSGYSANGNNGSVNDFFYEISNGHVNYTNVVTAYYRAIHPKSYYDNYTEAAGPKARELILEALEYLRDVEGMEFSQFDSDNDTYIDAINLYYAGNRSSGWSKGLWPHRSTVYGFTANGVSSKDYQVTDMRSYLTLGTFCHENGHMLFSWSDTYDYDSDSRGTGTFDLMSSSGNLNPKYPNPYFRHSEGWITPQILTASNQGTHFVEANNDADIFIYQNAAEAQERYYIEARKQENRHSTMPGEGVLIWHVDEYGNNSNNERWASRHFKVSVVQADGQYDLENNRSSGEAEDFFYAANNSSFSAKTQPEARWWDGDYSDLVLSNISSLSDNMSFDFAVALPASQIVNGDFSQSTDGWELGNAGGAVADVSIINYSASISITEGGTDDWNIQFRQGNLAIESGKQYRLAFTVYSGGSRTISVKVETDGSPWINYSKTTAFETDYNKRTYVHDFVADETDLNARIVFNLGGSNASVHVDNISLIELTNEPSPTLTSVEVDDMTIQLGTSADFTYRGYDQDGNVIALSQPVLSVNGGGTVTGSTFNAEELGNWNVTMTYGQFSTTANITVEDDGSAYSMVLNGDFANGITNWASSGTSSLGAPGQQLHAGISDGGSAAWSVQITQGAIPLEAGKKYRFSFDARSVQNRTIEAKLETDGSPWTNYSNTSPFSLTTSMQKFTQEFTMSETDMNARIAFNIGGSSADVIIDNVIVVEVADEPPVLSSIAVSPIVTTINSGVSVSYTGYDQFGNTMSIGLPSFTTTGGGWFKYASFNATEVGTFTMTMTYGGFEATASITVNDEVSSVNLVTNGDFGNGSNDWTLQNFEGASAYTTVNSNECSVNISNAGTSDWNVQFLQGNIPLESGKRYRFSFDARAAWARTISAHLETDGSPWTNYGSIPQTSVTETMSTYSYEFTMNQTDMNARIVFNLGAISADVVIDNVVVEEI